MLDLRRIIGAAFATITKSLGKLSGLLGKGERGNLLTDTLSDMFGG